MAEQLGYARIVPYEGAAYGLRGPNLVLMRSGAVQLARGLRQAEIRQMPPYGRNCAIVKWTLFWKFSAGGAAWLLAERLYSGIFSSNYLVGFLAFVFAVFHKYPAVPHGKFQDWDAVPDKPNGRFHWLLHSRFRFAMRVGLRSKSMVRRIPRRRVARDPWIVRLFSK